MTPPPLRKIRSRFLKEIPTKYPLSLVMLIDELSCGHLYYNFVDRRELLNAYTEDVKIRARRHRCHKCKQLIEQRDWAHDRGIH